MVRDYFLPAELEPCLEAVSRQVDELAARLHKAGKINTLHEDKGVFQRLTALEADFPGASVLLFKQGKLPKVGLHDFIITPHDEVIHDEGIHTVCL